jgi:tripartite-type tricarboxylate transporter receptor subunit TctC
LVLGRVKTEKPDGYTLFQTNLTMYSQIPHTRAVPYNPLKDFAYLAQHARFEQYLICRSDSPWKNWEELIQYAKKNPKTIKYGSAGTGSSGHIMMEYLGMKENLQWIHVPFNSVVEACTALLGGHLELVSMTLGAELEYVKTGRLHPLICYSDKRMQVFPDLPTVLEKGYDFSLNGSYIWSVPAATPKSIQKILEKTLLQAIADPEVREVIINKLNKTYDPVGGEEVTKALLKDHEKFGELMKQLGLGIFKK